jgi:DNA-binding NtrC family response regulator
MKNPTPESTESTTILLIDDDHIIREASKLEMIERGYVVLEADSFRAAKAILKFHHTIVDRVICGERLPDEAGQNIRHICDVLNKPCFLVSQASEWKTVL